MLDSLSFKIRLYLFFYLVPPYLNNPNGHYDGLINPQQFISFVKKIENNNKVIISEQNNQEELNFLKNTGFIRIFESFFTVFYSRN